MYLPQEISRITRRFAANPKGELASFLIGLGLILLTLPVLHLFLNGTFALADALK